LLHAHGRLSGWPTIHTDRHESQQPVPRRREASAERAVVVGPVLLARDLLAVRVGEDRREALSGEHLVAIAFLVHVDAQALVLDGLPGPVERPIGEEHRLPERRRGPPGVGPDHIRRGEPPLPAPRDDEVIASPIVDAEGAIAIGPGSRSTYPPLAIPRVPGAHLETID